MFTLYIGHFCFWVSLLLIRAVTLATVVQMKGSKDVLAFNIYSMMASSAFIALFTFGAHAILFRSHP